MSGKKQVKFFRGKVKSVDVEKGTAEIVISDETKDRHDERVLVTAFKKTKKEFMKHPILLSSHAYRGLQNQIGTFKKLTIDEKEKEVSAVVEYFHNLGNPESDWAWILAQKGIAAFSIGFIPKVWKDYTEEERKKNGGVWTDYEDIELLEVSQVLVPANPAALQRSFGEDDDDLFLKDLYSDIIEVMKDVEDGIEWKEEEKKEEVEVEKEKEEVEVEVEVKEEKSLVPEELTKKIDELKDLVAEVDEMVADFKGFYEKFVADVVKGVVEQLKKEVPVEEERKEIEVEEGKEEGNHQESVESIEEILGPEKVAELKSALFGEVSDENLRKLFQDMNNEVAERLSVQS